MLFFFKNKDRKRICAEFLMNDLQIHFSSTICSNLKLSTSQKENNFKEVCTNYTAIEINIQKYTGNVLRDCLM